MTGASTPVRWGEHFQWREKVHQRYPNLWDLKIVRKRLPFVLKYLKDGDGVLEIGGFDRSLEGILFIHLYQRGKITLIFKESIDGHWRNGERDYRRIMAEFAKLLESYILTYPEQYMGIYGPTVLSDYYRSQRKGFARAGER
jgi:hypothetical protein